MICSSVNLFFTSNLLFHGIGLQSQTLLKSGGDVAGTCSGKRIGLPIQLAQSNEIASARERFRPRTAIGCEALKVRVLPKRTSTLTWLQSSPCELARSSYASDDRQSCQLHQPSDLLVEKHCSQREPKERLQ